ncbi:hypothetical protein APHAL10511_000716 [Amanita phalloides]|nr:hypothetical protein APHAL10511_000716 [Amanita phalloides]
MSFYWQQQPYVRHQTRDYAKDRNATAWNRNAHSRPGNHPYAASKHNPYNSAPRGDRGGQARYMTEAHRYSPAETIHSHGGHWHDVQFKQRPPLPQAPRTVPTLTENNPNSQPDALNDLSLSDAQRTYTYNGPSGWGNDSHLSRVQMPWQAMCSPFQLAKPREEELDYRNRIREKEFYDSEVRQLVRQHGQQSTFDRNPYGSVRVQSRAPVVAKDDEKWDRKKPPVPIFSPAFPAAPIKTNKAVKDSKITKTKKEPDPQNPPNMNCPGLGLGRAPEERGIVPDPSLSSTPSEVVDKDGNGDAASGTLSTHLAQDETHQRSDLVQHKKAKEADNLDTKNSNLYANGTEEDHGPRVRDNIVPNPSTTADPLVPLAPEDIPETTPNNHGDDNRATLIPTPSCISTTPAQTQTKAINTGSGSTTQNLRFKKNKKTGGDGVPVDPPTLNSNEAKKKKKKGVSGSDGSDSAVPTPTPTTAAAAAVPTAVVKGKEERLARERDEELEARENLPLNKKKEKKKGGEEPSMDAGVVEKDARGGKEEGGESKKRGSKRKSLEEEKGERGELALGSSRKKTKKVAKAW